MNEAIAVKITWSVRLHCTTANVSNPNITKCYPVKNEIESKRCTPGAIMTDRAIPPLALPLIMCPRADRDGVLYTGNSREFLSVVRSPGPRAQIAAVCLQCPEIGQTIVWSMSSSKH
ncbi:hypothetical protein ElyMa_001233800 [Elysia marginata]|uniref:Uncharacterized protein n=1 Tax=Elysia marginata TaxID=1093978 RepID=A0AAV4I941_9GAST|nr:hypothetical protein ElyMa_001233800 [Elysia marginata]